MTANEPMKLKFKRKHLVKAAMITLYALMIGTMVVGWTMRGF